MENNRNTRKAKDSNKIKTKVDNWLNNKEYLLHGVSIDKLSKELGINRTYMSNYINDTYNVNFSVWINSMRIKEAKKIILNNPQMNIGQIASITGYTDLAHFSKQFKINTGVSPIKWKREQFSEA